MYPVTFTTPAERLRRFRKRKNLTLRRLARLTGINYQKIHHFEHGLQPREDELRRLAAALDCSPAELEEVRND